MSKYSGFFLSFLLILVCLWVNVVRYPTVWVTLDGHPLDPLSQNRDTGESVAPGIVSTSNVEPFSPYGTQTAKKPKSPTSRAPKPVVIPVSEPTPATPKKRADYFRTATLSDDIDSDQSTDTPEKSTESTEPPHSLYRAPGSPGTTPMNFDSPTYAAR